LYEETLSMKLNHIALALSLLGSLAWVAPAALAGDKHDHHDHGHDHDGEHREHGAHVHGIAALNLVLDGDEVHVELDSPAANIVGFEYAPSSEADHAALDAAVARLNDGDRMLRFNAEAGCRMEKAKVGSALLAGKHQAHADDHGHDKHEHAHEHDKHAHDHDDHKGDTHADIDVVYHFECAKPAELTQLSVELFDAFSGMEKLNVQYVIDSRQGAAELTPANHVIRF
jgi:hypothetical protein